MGSRKIHKDPTQHAAQTGVTTSFSLQPHVRTQVKRSPKGSSQAEAVNEVKSPLSIAPLVKGWTQSRGVSTSKKESVQVVGSFWGSDGSWATFKEEQFNYYTLQKSERDGGLICLQEHW